MNRREFLAGTVASVAAASAHAAYDGYRDWELVQRRVNDDADNVRLHFDFTKPLHGPWLTNPGAGSMTVSWISREKCAAAIEYRARGDAEWTRRWNTLYGMLDYSRDIHVFHLSGLRPATEYEYRFLSASSQYNTAYVGTCVGRETYSFKTFDPAATSYKVFVSADVHGAMRLVADAFWERTDAPEADMFLLLGDNVNDNMNEPRFYITSGFLDDIVRLWGKSRPTVFVRGNHDTWGRHAAEGWSDYFGRPDGRGYYAIEKGPALFVVLDWAEEYGLKSAASRETAAAYHAEQVAWFKALKNTDRWQRAKFRIVLSHYGTRIGSPRDPQFKAFSGDMSEALRDSSSAGRIHLLLCGHEHYYARCLPHVPGYYHNPRHDKPGAKAHVYPATQDADCPYTEIAGAYCEAMTLEVSESSLKVRSHDVRDAGATDLDGVTIKPDGSAAPSQGMDPDL